MQEPEKCESKLLVVAKNVVAKTSVPKTAALADPTCEEGGGAKLREGSGANAGKTTLCKTDPADFCTRERKEGAKAGEVSGNSVRTWLEMPGWK